MRDRCSHYGAKLSFGRLQPLVVGDDVGDRHFAGPDEVILRCPWHGYEFDIDTGRCVADPDHQSVRTYRLVVQDGTVFLDR
jgi:3-phenylpropionate/trans-cinnamate dioxygenase ferredoxin subunit